MLSTRAIASKASQFKKSTFVTDASQTSKIFDQIKNKGHVVRIRIDKSMLKQMDGTAVRADTRGPKEIFPNGFQPKGSRSDSLIVCYRPRMLRTESGQYLSKRLESASYFPIPNPSSGDEITDTYAYVINKPEVFDTSELIAKVYVNADSCRHNIDRASYLRDLAFEEVGTPNVPPAKVLMALHLTDRKLSRPDILNYIVEFKIADYSVNPDATEEEQEICGSYMEKFPIGLELCNSTDELSEETLALIEKFESMRTDPERSER